MFFDIDLIYRGECHTLTVKTFDELERLLIAHGYRGHIQDVMPFPPNRVFNIQLWRDGEYIPTHLSR